VVAVDQAEGGRAITVPQPLESGLTGPGFPSSTSQGSGAYIWATPDRQALPGARLGVPPLGEYSQASVIRPPSGEPSRGGAACSGPGCDWV
jgi:hypothetical protein